MGARRPVKVTAPPATMEDVIEAYGIPQWRVKRILKLFEDAKPRDLKIAGNGDLHKKSTNKALKNGNAPTRTSTRSSRGRKLGSGKKGR
jgi:hypothetical protein